jgi:hypothetical protein
MAGKRPFNAKFFALAAITLLLFGATLGSVWHTHEDAASAAQCQFCQLGHLPAEVPATIAPAQFSPCVVGVAVPEEQRETLSAVDSPQSPRAPPLAA